MAPLLPGKGAAGVPGAVHDGGGSVEQWFSVS